MIDAHIHLDQYQDAEIDVIAKDPLTEGLITVSTDLRSCQRNLALSSAHKKMKAAFGYHPEQPLPSDEKLAELTSWMEQHRDEAIAIGEVGLPHYLRLDGKVSNRAYQGYVELLETFLQMARDWEKPVALHAVYEDAATVCDLLEKHEVTKAHFHWFKGDQSIVNRMIDSGYFISVTPDVVYEKEIQTLVRAYPLERLMIETDGPWPFEGPFSGMPTRPRMLEKSIETIASIKGLPPEAVKAQLAKNVKAFYSDR